MQSVQSIFNIFRQRPADLFFSEAQRRYVGILARVPLSSGLLSGKFTRASTFAPDDHRAFNRHGEAFDRGETFSGLDYEVGLQAVEALRALVPPKRIYQRATGRIRAAVFKAGSGDFGTIHWRLPA